MNNELKRMLKELTADVRVMGPSKNHKNSVLGDRNLDRGPPAYGAGV